MVHYSAHGLNSELKVQYSRHGLTGPIAEQSKSSDLDRGRGDLSSNPGKGCYGDGEQRIIEGYYSHD